MGYDELGAGYLSGGSPRGPRVAETTSLGAVYADVLVADSGMSWTGCAQIGRVERT
jgi:hypothetical protein